MLRRSVQSALHKTSNVLNSMAPDPLYVVDAAVAAGVVVAVVGVVDVVVCHTYALLVS